MCMVRYQAERPKAIHQIAMACNDLVWSYWLADVQRQYRLWHTHLDLQQVPQALEGLLDVALGCI